MTSSSGAPSGLGWPDDTFGVPDGGLGWPRDPRGGSSRPVDEALRTPSGVPVSRETGPTEGARVSRETEPGWGEGQKATMAVASAGTLPAASAAGAGTQGTPGLDAPGHKDGSAAEPSAHVSRETSLPAVAGTPFVPGAAARPSDAVSRETLVPNAEPDDVGTSAIPPHETPLATELAEEARRRAAVIGRRLPAPSRTRVLTVANQKGGVGKTTTTVNVAAALAQGGLRVLVIDIDPQGNASTALGIDHHAEVPSVYDVLVDGDALADVIQECADLPGLYCAPATIDLAGAEIELVSLVARETRLKRAIDAHLRSLQAGGEPRIDYVLIDCPPSLGLLTVNAFVAAEEVLIPIQCEYYALEGLSALLKNIEMIKSHLNPQLHVSTILMTMYDGRTRLSAQVADDVRAHFPEQVLRATVPRSVRISEAPSHGQTVMTYDPSSSGALSYLEAATELARRGAAVSAS